MGYKVQRVGTIVRIEDRPGLEVKVRPVSVQQLLELQRLVLSIGDLDLEKPGEDELAAFEKVLRAFAGVIEDWNLEEEEGDEPIPATFDGLASLDVNFAMELIEKCIEGVSQAPRPLPTSSSSTSLDADLQRLLASSSATPTTP
jgi:hypothetical protein